MNILLQNLQIRNLKAFLDGLTTIKKITDDISDIYSHLGVWTDPNPVTASIANIKKDITDIKTITDKVKHPNDAENIKNLVYVVNKGWDEYISGIPLDHTIAISIQGIYRFSIISEHQFNIKVWDIIDPNIQYTGVNTVIITVGIESGKTGGEFVYSVKPVDETVVRTGFIYIVEFMLRQY